MLLRPKWLLSLVDTRSDTNYHPNHRSVLHTVLPQTKSIKIIKDRDDRPKGFGYIEFATLDGLKDALARSGQNLASRIVRVSVAEPRKPELDQLSEPEAQSTLLIQPRNVSVDPEASTMIPSSLGRGGEKDRSQI